MNTPHLRTFLYDTSHQELDILCKQIFSAWDDGIGVSVIDTNAPQYIVDSAIISLDPDEVVNISNQCSSYSRNLAIFEEAISVVSLTSGSTNKPKPVVHTFDSMRESVNAIANVLDLNKDDSWLLCLSPKYIAGMATLARAHILEQKVDCLNIFNVQSIAEMITNLKPSLISLVPTQLQILVDCEIDLSCFKAILVGGASVDSKLIEQCSNLEYNIHRTYGMTETFGGICHDGKLFPNTNARIIDGEIQLRSTSIFSSYRHNYSLSQSKFTNDAWYKTGDIGLIDGDNTLTVSGRIDDIIISGGIKINPNEIENTLSKYIDQLFIVGGIPHRKWGHALSVVFEKEIPYELTIEKIRELLSNDFDRKYLPIYIAAIEEFPKTSTGKYIRKEILEKCKIIEEYT